MISNTFVSSIFLVAGMTHWEAADQPKTLDERAEISFPVELLAEYADVSVEQATNIIDALVAYGIVSQSQNGYYFLAATSTEVSLGDIMNACRGCFEAVSGRQQALVDTMQDALKSVTLADYMSKFSRNIPECA